MPLSSDDIWRNNESKYLIRLKPDNYISGLGVINEWMNEWLVSKEQMQWRRWLDEEKMFIVRAGMI